MTDANGAMATASFTLTVNAAVTASTTIASKSLTQNASANFTPVASSGGTGSLTYSISPTLPAGLSINTSTGAISGTATVASATTSYTVTVTDQNGATASSSLTLVVIGLTTVGVTSSAAPGIVQTSIIFTATVSSAAGTPTGTVTFLDGTTPLGTGSLSGGLATFATTSLAIGSHSITATYAGDTNFASSASGVLTEVVVDYTVTPMAPTGTGGGSAGSDPSATVQPGGTATVNVSILPSTGTSFPAVLTLTLTGLPTGATATISPSVWAQSTETSWTLPAGTSLSSSLAIGVTVPQATANGRVDAGGFGRRGTPFALALLLLPFAGRMRRAGKGMTRLLSLALLLIIGIGTAGLSGCGADNGFFAQSPTTSTVTVTVTSGALVRSTAFTITVE